MNKWKIPFLSKTNKPLKKLWFDYTQVYYADKVWTIQRQKQLQIFIEAIESYRDQPISSIFEELDQNHEQIFSIIIESSNDYLKSLIKDRDKYDEEAGPSLEFLQKMLYIAEVFLSIESKISIIKVIDTYPAIPRTIVSIVAASFDKSALLIMLRIIKRMLVNVTILKQFMRVNILDSLLFIYQKFQDTSFIQQILYLLILIIGNLRFSFHFGDKTEYYDVQRARTLSTSSIGSASGRTRRAQMNKLNNNSSPIMGRAQEISTERAALTTVNFAWSFFTEIIKYTPIASSWLGPREEKSPDDTASKLDELNFHDFNNLMSNLVLSSDDIESERNRLTGLGPAMQDDQSADEKVPEDSKESEIICFLEEHQVKILSLLITALNAAVTPGDVISIITFISVIIPKNSKLQEIIFDQDRIALLLEVILRIEDNLPLIAPNKANKSKFDLEKEDKGKFYSFAGAEFDEYYVNLVVLLTKLAIDEQIADISGNISPFPRGYQIKNYGAVVLIKHLLECKYHSLVAVAIRVCCHMIRLNPANCVALEVKGILSVAILCLYRLQFFGSLDKDEKLRVFREDGGMEDESTHSKRSKAINPFEISSLDLFAEISLLLQLFAVSFSRRDSSILAAFTFLLLASWNSVTADHSVFKNIRCMNCETEFACFECVAESCVKDRFFRLCKDCDLVFHKSAMKRRHVRLPLIQICSVHSDAHDQHGLPKEIKCFSWTEVLRALQHHRPIVDSYVQLQEKFVKNDYVYWREVTSCLLLKSMKGLIDDRKSRGMEYGIYLQESCSLVLRHCIMESCGLHDNAENLRLYERLFAKVLFQTDYESGSQPPATHQYHPKRIMINYLLQILSRFYMYRTFGDDGVNNQGNEEKTILNLNNNRSANIEFTPNIAAAVKHFSEFGIMGALIYCATEDSNFVPLILDDCQFIFWFLRESCVAAIETNSTEIVTESLLWYNWLLSAETSLTSGARNKGSISYAPPNSKNKSANRPFEPQKIQLVHEHRSSLNLRCRLPEGSPLLTNCTKLMLTQELRVLISGYCDGIIRVDGDDESLNPKLISGVYTIPCLVKDSSPSNGLRKHHQRPSNSFGKKLTNKHEVAEMKFSLAFNSTILKKSVIQAGVIKSLVELCLGERVPKSVQALLFGPHRGGMSPFMEDLNEMEKELYWMSLMLLLELLTDSKECKDELDRVYGIAKFTKFLLKLLDCLDNSQYPVRYIEQYITAMLVEFSIDDCRIIPPFRPFKNASLLFPRAMIQADPSSKSHTTLIIVPKSLLTEFNATTADIPLEPLVLTDNFLSSIYFTTEQVVALTSRVFSANYYGVHHFLMLNEESYSKLGMTSFINLPFLDVRLSGEDGSQHGVPKDVDNLQSVADLNARSSSVRRISKKNFSSASVPSLGDNSWEVDSVGRMSGIQGDLASRGSLNSHQSMQAVMHAVKAIPAHVLLSSTTNFAETSHSNDNVPIINRKLLANKADSPPQIDIIEGQHVFPFPNFSVFNGNNQLPSSNSSFLLQIDSVGNIGIAKILVCCHNYLLCTSGLQKWISDEGPEESEAYEHESPMKSSPEPLQPEWFTAEIATSPFPILASVDGYYYVLRKHLSLFLTPAANSNSSRSINYWSPNFSWGKFRNDRAVDILLTTLLTVNHRMQTTMMKYILALLEGNPSNARIIGHNNVATLSLCRNLLIIPSSYQEFVSTILTHSFSYFSNLFSVRYLLESSITFTGELNASDKGNSAVKNLFVVGKAVEPNAPFSFLQFEMKNCFKSSLMLPPFSDGSGGSSSTGAITIACWLRVGSVGNAPIITLFQMISEPAGIIVNVFLRKLWNGSQNSNDERLQLCISFSHKSKSLSTGSSNQLNEDFVDDGAWQTAVNFLLGGDDTAEFGEQDRRPSNESNYYSGSSSLMQSFMKFIFPDCVIDYNWKEMGDWHLLVISFQSDGISCSVDSVEKPVLYFSPFGYLAASTMPKVSKGCGEERSVFYQMKDQIKAMLSSLESSSKGNSLTAALGGLLFEKAMINDIIGYMNEMEGPELDSKSKMQRDVLKRLIASYSNSIRGFSGLIGDVAFLDGRIDAEMMINIVKDGASKGLKQLKGKILSSLFQQTPNTPLEGSSPRVHAVSKSTPSRSSTSIIGSEPTVSNDAITEIEAVRQPFQSTNLFVVQRSANLFKFIKSMGGIKLLFPLFREESSLTIAALRVLSNIIYDDEDYEEFKREKLDKMLLYSLSSGRVQSSEAMQVLFDMILNTTIAIQPASAPTAHLVNEVNDRFKRIDLLKLVVDLAMCCHPNAYISKTVLEWMKGILTNSKENLFLFIKHIGFYPLQILISKWTVTDFTEITSLVGDPRQLLPNENSNFIELEKKKVSFVEGSNDNSRSAHPSRNESMVSTITNVTNTSGNNRHESIISTTTNVTHPSRHESVVSTITSVTNSSSSGNNRHESIISTTTNVTNNSGGSGNSNEDNYRPVDVSDRKLLPPARNHSIMDLKWLDTSQEYLATYKMHLTSLQILKIVFAKLFTESFLEQYLKFSGESLEYFNFSLSNFISFIMLCARARVSDPSRRDIVTAKQKRESAKKSEKMKSSIKSHLRTVTLLKDIDIFDSKYWQLSSALLLLNEFLRLGDAFNSRLKFLFPAQNLALLGLELINSEAVEVKDCGLRVIMLFLSGSDRKIDPRQLAVFEKINGFQYLTENISNHVDYYCSDILIERLFSFLFWKLDEWLHSTYNSKEKIGEMGTANPSELFDSSGNAIRNSKNLTNDIETGTTVETATTTTNMKPIEVDSHHQGTANAGLSPSKLSPAPSLEMYSTEKMEIIVPQVFEVIMRLLQTSKSVEQVRRSFHILENSFGPQFFILGLRNKADKATTNSSNNNYDHTISGGGGGGGGSILKSESSSIASSRNMDLILSLKDWIVNLTDIIIVYRRKANNDDADNSVNLFSQSESESVGGGVPKGSSGSHISNEEDYSGYESEENNSAFGGTEDGTNLYEDSISPDQFNSLKDQEYLHTRQYMTEQLTQSIFDFIKILIIYDFTQKYSLTRKWNEIFRLSLPETSNLQEEIILYVLENIHLNPYLSTTDLSNSNNNSNEIGMNILRNLGYFLEQVLEKVKLSLKCCSKIIQILYSLNYHCSLEMRSKMKDTVLPEVRKSCIIRCLIDVGQDVYVRITILEEISTSLHGYLALTESKAMTDAQIIILILGMFIEVLEEPEYPESSNYHHRTEAKPINISNAPAMASNENMTALLRIVLKVIQTCTTASVECRKTVIRMSEGLSSDPSALLLKVFTNNFKRSDSVHPSRNHYPQPSESSLPRSDPASAAASTTWWWGGSTNTAAPSLTAVGRQLSGQSRNDDFTIDEGKALNDHSIALDMEAGDLTNSNPQQKGIEETSGDTSAFIEWFCALERRELQAEFRNRIIKELKNVLRTAEKLRERFSQRLLKYTKTLHDKKTRDKLGQSKLLSDSIFTVQSYNDKLCGSYLKEIQQYMKLLKEKIAAGHQLYHGLDAKGNRKDVPPKFGFSDKNAERLYQELNSFHLPSSLMKYFQEKERILLEVEVKSNTTRADSRSEEGIGSEGDKGEGREDSMNLPSSHLTDLDAFEELIKYFDQAHQIQDRFINS